MTGTAPNDFQFTEALDAGPVHCSVGLFRRRFAKRTFAGVQLCAGCSERSVELEEDFIRTGLPEDVVTSPADRSLGDQFAAGEEPQTEGRDVASLLLSFRQSSPHLRDALGLRSDEADPTSLLRRRHVLTDAIWVQPPKANDFDGVDPRKR